MKDLGKWLDEPMDLDEFYGKPTGNEWKYEVAAIILFLIFVSVVIIGYI